MSVLTNRHPREPEFSCKSLDYLIGKACETHDNEYIGHIDRVRKLFGKLREWGRKEAREVDLWRSAVRETLEEKKDMLP